MIRFNFAYSDTKSKQKLKGSIRNAQDSKFWISLSPGLGIEVAKLFLTQDSVKVLNRLKKNYFLGDYAYFSEKFGIGIDYKSVESIFRNNLFLYSNQDIAKISDYKLNSDSLYYSLTKKVLSQENGLDTLIFHKILIDKIDFSINYVELIDKTIGFTTKLKYSNFVMVENKRFPKKIELQVISKKSNFDINLDYLRIDSDRTLNFPFNIPNDYKQVKY